jgi:chaperonin GroES
MFEAAKVGEFLPVNTEFEHPFARIMNGHIVIAVDGFHYSGRLTIPEVAKRKPTKGKVIAVADNITDVKIGDRILYSQFAGYALGFEGLPIMRIIGYEEVLAILKEKTPDLVSEGS